MFVRELVTALARARIDYCVVGGLAVNLHGVERQTYNVDLVVPREPDTLAALESLLVELGLSCREPLELAELANERHRRKLLLERNLTSIAFCDPRDALREVDVIVAPALAPRQLLRRAVKRKCEGVPVRVAALPDLMLMKRVSGWQLDADDVARLERVRGGRSKRRR